jgi:hypothetical protein
MCPLRVRQRLVRPPRRLPLPPSRRDLVPRPLGDELALELGKGQEHVQYQPTHGRRAMKLLGDGDEGDLVLVKDLHDPSKIEQRATEAIDFVCEHAIELTGGDILEEPLEGGPVQVAAAMGPLSLLTEEALRFLP